MSKQDGFSPEFLRKMIIAKDAEIKRLKGTLDNEFKVRLKIDEQLEKALQKNENLEQLITELAERLRARGDRGPIFEDLERRARDAHGRRPNEGRMKAKRIEAGRYQIGNTFVVKRLPIVGRHQTVTWRDALTGEWLGYTLYEAKRTLARKLQRAREATGPGVGRQTP